MSALNSRTPGKTTWMSLLSAAALVLSLVSNLGVGQAFSRTGSPARVAAGVYVDIVVSKTLWASTLDPALISLVDDGDIVNKIYAGLVKQVYDDKTGRFTIVPDLASGMPTISKNGLVYTFKIRKGAAFSDGTPVTAQAFVWSFRRVLEPKVVSPVAYYLGAIKGASAYNAGKLKSFSDVGIKALDAHTVQFTLARPVVWFLYALSYYTGFVLKQSVPVGAKLTTTPSLVVGAGPWMLKNHTWKYRSEIDLVPNPYYYRAKSFKIKEIHILFTGTVDTELNGYKSGEFPQTALPAVEVKKYRGTPEFRETVILGDVWYAMNVHIKPFTDLHFRRAVAYAIDRNAIANGILRGTVKPQYGWYPKGILGYEPHILSDSAVPRYDPARARRELALATKDLGTIPPVQLEVNTEDPDRVRMSNFIVQELKAIGIKVTVHLVPGSTWSADGNSGKTQFIYENWLDDYPDPQDFSYYLIETGAGENWGRYSNPRVDALFAKGDVERDVQKREAIYKQAQLIILHDAAVAMINQFAAQALITNKYHGLELNPSWGTYFQPVGNDWANVTVSS
jgi:oligopeptide transport system substrate-binding protein